MNKLLSRFWRFVTRHDKRLAKQRRYLTETMLCRSEKLWMALRRDMIGCIHGAESIAYEHARQAYHIESWGHMMVGADRDTHHSHPLPSIPANLGLEQQTELKRLLENYTAEHAALMDQHELALQAQLITARF